MTRSMRRLLRVSAGTLVLLAAGCARFQAPSEYLATKQVSYPAPAKFTVCHGYDCTFRTPVELDAATWARIRAAFAPAPADAAAEREQIISAIALFENAIGDRLGTHRDIPGLAGILAGDPTQQDCIDESINATVFLILLRDQGLLRWHAPSAPAFRGVFVDFRWYHQTAVLREKATGEEFALDTWFRKNGERAYLVRLEDWRWGYGLPAYSLTKL